MTEAADIIKAFDDCLEYVWGYGFGRDNPHAGDKATATKWIDDGLTVTGAVIVFYEQMNWMHEKWLRRGNAGSRDGIPRALKIFDENIASMIYRLKHGSPDAWQIEESKWSSRCRAWMKTPSLWQSNHWGPPPNEKNCRAPKSILIQLEILK